MPLKLFCPQCAAYLGPCTEECPNPDCNFQRPSWDCLPAPGQPHWTARLPGAIRGGTLFLPDDQALVAWGMADSTLSSNERGGLEWFDLRSGQPAGQGLRFDSPLVGQVARFENLVFLSLGGRSRYDNGAAAAVDLGKRRLAWGLVELPGLLACGPLLNQSQVLYACGDGQVHPLRLSDGSRLPPLRFLSPDRSFAGPPALLASRGRICVPTHDSHGQVFAAQLGQARPLAEFDNRITALSCLKDGRLLVGLKDGRLYFVDPAGWEEPQEFFRIGGGLFHPPLEEDGLLYFGGKDHHLYALRLDGEPLPWSSKTELDGTPGVTPRIARRLLFVGDSHGVVSAVDPVAGHLAWRYHLQSDHSHDPVTSLSWGAERLLVGTRSGLLICLPWHLGRYAEMVERVDISEAGDYWSAAADFTPQARSAHELRLKAAHAWEESGQAEKAAAMWQAAGRLDLAAPAYELAAEGIRHTRPERAAGLYVAAIQLWNDLFWDGTPEGNRAAEERRDQAINRLRLLPGLLIPLLKLRLANAPSFVRSAEGRFTIELKNIGKIAAFGIQFYIGGGLDDDVCLPAAGQPPFDPHMPGETLRYKFTVAPSRQVPLRIDLDYHDYLHKFPPMRTTLIVPIDISEAMLLHTGDIGYLNLVGVERVVLKTRDVGGIRASSIDEIHAAGDIAAIHQSGSASKKVCPACEQAGEAAIAFCTRCGTKF